MSSENSQREEVDAQEERTLKEELNNKVYNTNSLCISLM